MVDAIRSRLAAFLSKAQLWHGLDHDFSLDPLLPLTLPLNHHEPCGKAPYICRRPPRIQRIFFRGPPESRRGATGPQGLPEYCKTNSRCAQFHAPSLLRVSCIVGRCKIYPRRSPCSWRTTSPTEYVFASCPYLDVVMGLLDYLAKLSISNHSISDVVMGFLDYLAMSSQGQIGENITVGTLIGKVGVWIGMVSNLLITSITILTLSR